MEAEGEELGRWLCITGEGLSMRSSNDSGHEGRPSEELMVEGTIVAL